MANVNDAIGQNLAYPVLRSEFEEKTVQLLRLARSGLIYLSLSMHHEESVRARARPGSLILPMALDLWRDAWKR
jgi:hypothetical protein